MVKLDGILFCWSATYKGIDIKVFSPYPPPVECGIRRVRVDTGPLRNDEVSDKSLSLCLRASVFSYAKDCG